MGKSNWAKFIKNTQATLSKHTPEILTGFGIAGMITTTVLAVRATPKALEMLQDAEIEKYDEQVKAGTYPEDLKGLTPVEVIKTAWKPYVPAAVTGVASIACLIGASSVHVRRHAALATAYKLSETALSEYREKVVEHIGEKKEHTIREKVAKKQVQDNPASKNEVIVTGTGDTRFFDPMSGRHFLSTVEKIKKAENDVNKRMIHDICGYASLNEFYDEINLPRTDVGDIIGWNAENLIDMGVSAQVDDDGQPSIVLDYISRPDYNYDR